MGDRTTPMKFGPEWLRNLNREPTSPGSSGGGAQITLPIRPLTSAATTWSNTTSQSNTSKVLLAKLRYGREEMLALYDRQTAEAPSQLKSIELLYQTRGKPPYALNNNFEDDTRDSSMRNNPPIGGTNPADRYGQGRGRGMSMCDGRGRGMNPSESRGRARGFVRQTSLGRTPSWHNGGQRTYPADDDPNQPRGLWNNGNGMNPPGIRPNAEQADWANKTAYRKNRQNHTNWRQQPNREEGEEWRSSDGARRGQEKWEREWPGSQEKPWSNNNRRQWTDNEDSLPEWAVENSEACGGTFDSSGAFHGFSNDDINIPKNQEVSYPLARSHTHGSFARSKTVEEGSEEWWASEKAKKLSAKRFDATEVQFKKHTTSGISEENAGGNANASAASTVASTVSVQTRDKLKQETRNRSDTPPTHDYNSEELQDEAAAFPAKRVQEHDDDKQKEQTYQKNYSENTAPTTRQRIDMLIRANELDLCPERGNYNSVMMTPNNNHLRQKHQNIGSPTNEAPKRISHMFESAQQQPRQNRESSEESQQKQHETKLVEDLLDMNLNDELQAQLLNATTQAAGKSNQMSNPGMQMNMNNPLLNPNLGMSQPTSNMPSCPGMQQGSMMRPIGMTNSMLNASLGLPMGSGSNMGLPLSNMPSAPITNPGMLSSSLQGLGGSNLQNPMQGMQGGLQQSSMQVGGMQSGMQSQGMQGNGFQTSGGMPGSSMQSGGMSNTNLQAGTGIPVFQGPGNSLFLGTPNTMQNPNDMSMHVHGPQSLYPMHAHNMQSSFNAASMYVNMIQPPTGPLPNIPLTEQWYYEDPKKTIQGPFTSKEMFNWYRAGFFSPELMVRRACESGLRPLANYGLMPFGPMDLMPPQYSQMTGRYDMRGPTTHDNGILNQQAGLGPEVESLWSQPSANDMMWIQQPTTPRDDNSRVNNLSMYFWDQPSGMSTLLLPEGVAKEMKTEDEILAQMRASQADPASQKLTFMSDAVSPEDAFTAGTNIAPNLEELQKLIESDVHGSSALRATAATEVTDDAAAAAPPILQRAEKKIDKLAKAEPIPEVSAKQPAPIKIIEARTAKPTAKLDEKPAKAKEVATAKTKTKKQKEEKKEDGAEIKVTEEKTTEKRSEERSPNKSKKEDKANKKDLEKEKKEWLKDGFTIVKGTEKKENKKKEKEEARAAEEAEKKKKEDEKRALLEAEKNRTPEPVTRKQQLEFGQVQRQQPQVQQVELAPKKAPWSAPTPAGKDGLALSDIQRLEREKKLEEMKEQQQIMQATAQQQAAAVAALKEQQEMQAGQLGWAKKKQPNVSVPGQTLAEIQAEARLQAAAIAAAATAAAAREEVLATPPPINVAPWGATNGGGFWDSPTCFASSAKGVEKRTTTDSENSKTIEVKPKKRVTVVPPLKKEVSPSADFDTWCSNVLANWRDAANIDVPTFIAFLRDIESPYEVKDYVKCYLGDTKESNDFSRQFLERRSRLLRVGMVTPSDDLCSPAAAVNPRTNSGSDYTEVKSKGKKTKKNKMFKVDARILGFSVTASEDRINIGDIDSV